MPDKGFVLANPLSKQSQDEAFSKKAEQRIERAGKAFDRYYSSLVNGHRHPNIMQCKAAQGDMTAFLVEVARTVNGRKWDLAEGVKLQIASYKPCPTLKEFKAKGEAAFKRNMEAEEKIENLKQPQSLVPDYVLQDFRFR